MEGACHVVDATMFWSQTGGGVRRYLLAKHAWLAGQRGWRHTIAVPGTAGEQAVDGLARLPGWPLPASGGYRLPLRRAAVATALRALAPDLVEAGDPYRVAWGALDAAQSLGVPAVAYCHSNIERMAALVGGRFLGAAAGRIARGYARHVYGSFDLVLAPSRHMCAQLLDWGVQRVACQPLGVDSAIFHPSRASVSWRSELGIAASTRVLVYAGRFAAEKHLDVLAAAVRRLGPAYAFVAIGAGPVPPPSGPGVVVLPFMSGSPALATALASADAFVHAGDQETFGLSLLEAMACGTPVVARAAAGLAEQVDERCGVTVAEGSATAFAAAIEALFERDQTALRQGARRHAAGRDWQRVLPELLGRYRQLLGGDAGHGDRDGPTDRSAADGARRAGETIVSAAP